jgi:Ca-activated chloride channel family protein
MVTMGFTRLCRYAGVLVAFLLFGQDTIRVTVSEVLVPVTVTDPKGRFVSNLDKEDFKIYDNGQEQTIDYFSRDRNQPVVIGFLVDLSNGSKIHWKDYQEATINLVDTLMPGGDKRYSGYLIGYSTEPDLKVDTTHDSEVIVDQLRGLKPGGGAALYDAIYEACTNRKLVVGEPIEPRRVVVIIGDGHDNASKKTFQEVLELAQRQLVTIYGVSTSSYGTGSDVDDDVLLKLAKATGGKVEYPLENVYRDIAGYLEVPTDYGNYAYDVGTGGYSAAKASSIFRAIANLSGEITTQYILRYVPDIPEDSKNLRDIKVTVNLPDVKVRARQAYYPFSVPGVKNLQPR